MALLPYQKHDSKKKSFLPFSDTSQLSNKEVITIVLVYAQDPMISYASSSISQFIRPFGSQAGGQRIFIKGTNFPNDITTINILFGPYPCIPRYSNPYYMECITTKATSIPQFTIYLPLKLSIADRNPVTCSTATCQYFYAIGQTPFIQEFYPRSIMAGGQLNIFAVHQIDMIGNGITPAIGQINYILIGNKGCILYDVTQPVYKSNSASNVICQVPPTMQAGQYNITYNSLYGYPNTTVDAQTFSLFTLNTYKVRVVYWIQSIPYQKSGRFGRLLTLTGQFPGLETLVTNDLTCSLKEVPCQVIVYDDSHVQIKIPSYSYAFNSSSSSSSHDVFPGAYGFRYTRYQPTALYDINDLKSFVKGTSNLSLIFDQEMIITQLSTPYLVTYPYLEVIKGLIFIPVQGQYSYEISCDDCCVVQQSAEVGTSDKALLSTILTLNYFTPSTINPYSRSINTNLYTRYYNTSGYYYTEIHVLNPSRSGFFKLSIRYSDLTRAAAAFHRSANLSQQQSNRTPTYKIETFNITPAYVLPQIVQVLLDVSTLKASNISSFYLYIQQSSATKIVFSNSSAINIGDSAYTFGNKVNQITAIWNYNPRYIYIMKDQLGNAITNLSLAKFISYQIIFDRTRNKGEMFLPLSNVKVGISTFFQQQHSDPIAGFYSILIGNKSLLVGGKKLIPAAAINWDLARALNQFYNTSEINVAQLADTFPLDQLVYSISYIGVDNPFPLSVNTDLLTGGVNSTFVTTVTINRNYTGTSLYYSSIPLQFLRTAQQKPSIVVTTNQLPIICDNCSLYYDLDSTPTVNFITLDGLFLQIGLTDNNNIGFELKDIVVFISTSICDIKTGRISNFTCQIPNQSGHLIVPPGSVVPQVHVQQIGFADTSSISPIQFPIVFKSITPSTSQITGGTFDIYVYRMPIDTQDITVVVCGVNSTIKLITANTIKVVVPPSQVGCLDETYVGYNGTKNMFTFQFLSSNYTVTAVSSSFLSPFVPQDITITGTNFPSNLTVILQNSQSFLRYQLVVLSVNDNSLVCRWQGGISGNYQIALKSGQNEQSTGINLSVGIFITSITPDSGSLGGGYSLTISGINFLLAYQSSVSIGQGKCEIKSINSSVIKCEVPQISRILLMGQPLEVMVTTRGVSDSICLGNCSFVYGQNLTRFTAPLANSSFKAGDSIILALNNTTGVSQLFVDSFSYPFTVTNDTLLFVYPQLQAGLHFIRIKSNGSFLYPSIQTTTVLSFNSSLSIVNSSTAGSYLTISGNGLGASINRKPIVISMTCGTTKTILPQVSANPSMVTVLVPAITAQNCKINYLWGTSSRTFNFFYINTSTPSVSYQWIGNYTYRITKTILKTTTYNSVALVLLDERGTMTKVQYTMNVTVVSSFVLSVVPQDNYLPAGGYTLLAFSSKNGFAAVDNAIPIMQPFMSNLSSSAARSSYQGVKKIQITGTGFVLNKQFNNVRVCGFNSIVEEVNQSSITIQLPALVTQTTHSLYGLGKEASVKGQWFADTPNNLQFVQPGIYQDYFYSSNNQVCYVGIDTGNQTAVWVKKIIYIPNLIWKSTSVMLSGAVFQASMDLLQWDVLFQIDTTLVHSGVNYWLNTNNIIVTYRFVRFRHNSSSMCQLASLEVIGILMAPDNQLNDYVCNIKIITFNSTVVLPNPITYADNETVIVTAIYPPYGPIEGATTLKVTGSGFSSNLQIIIDNVECTIINSSATEIYCLTGPRMSYQQANTFVVRSMGNAAMMQCYPFLYVTPLSTYYSLLGQIPPINLENITILEGTNLLIDEDTAYLNQIIVEKGKLIVADADITIRIQSLIINNGELLIGTSQQPLSSNLNIAVNHTSLQSPSIICNNCRFKVFGRSAQHSWCRLITDISSGDTTLSVDVAVDWRIGQVLVVASSSQDTRESEYRTIVGLSNSNQTITVDKPFTNAHSGSIQQFGQDIIDMRAEVGLLTRNIKLFGINKNNGITLAFNGTKKDGLAIEGSWLEMFNCGADGQACIFISQAGEMKDSYLQSISVYNTSSRMLVIEGTDYFKVNNCIGYNITGNGITMPTGSQTNNIITNNLLLNIFNNYQLPFLDTYSAAYFLSHPYNQIEGNRAAGGQFFGFHFLFPNNSEFSSLNLDLCPPGSKILYISNNTAHSFAQFGFRLYKLAGRQFPCLSMQNETLIDPYSANPSVHNQISHLTSYKNRIGFIGQILGNIELLNLRVSDNKIGIQIHLTNFSKEPVVIKNSLIIGNSNNNVITGSIGLITARTHNFAVQGASFYNFIQGTTAIQSCSQCELPQYLVTGGVITSFKNIVFVNISGKYIVWNTPMREIFTDLDGSLTPGLQNLLGLQAATRGAITPYRHSLIETQTCSYLNNIQWGNSIFCGETVNLKSIIFANFIPTHTSNILIRKLDSAYHNISLEKNTSIYSSESFIGNLPSLDISSTWGLPFMTSRFYNVHWATGVDFTHLSLALNQQWTANESLVLRFNSTAQRSGYFVKKYYTQQLMVNSLQKGSIIDPLTCINGQFFHDITNQYLFVCVSGRERQIRQWIDINTTECFNFCPNMTQPGMQTFLRMWSNQTQWPNQQLPTNGSNVTIPFQWNLLLDVDVPDLYYLEINGNLIFDRSRNNILRAHVIWVKTGKIWIGSAANPFANSAIIQLLGQQSDPDLSFGPFKGKKMLVVTGGLQLYGFGKTSLMPYLTADAQANDSSLSVSSTQDWQSGDLLIITSSSVIADTTETAQISSITGNQILLKSPLIYQHYGSPNSTLNNSFGSIDRRTIVAVLSRNIKIRNGDSSSLKGQILVTSIIVEPVDSPYLQSKVQGGFINMFNTQIYGFGGVGVASLTIADLAAFGPNLNSSKINGSSIYSCVDGCLRVTNSANLSVSFSVLAFSPSFVVQNIKVDSFNFTSNLLASIGSIGYNYNYSIANKSSIHFEDNTAICGGMAIGYILPYLGCQSSLSSFSNNLAGLCGVGLSLFGNGLHQCLKATSLFGFGNLIGVFSNITQQNTLMILDKLFLFDCRVGVALSFASLSLRNVYFINNSYFNAFSNSSQLSFYKTSGGCYSSQMLSFVRLDSLPIFVDLDNLYSYLPSYGSVYLRNSMLQNYNTLHLSTCNTISVFPVSPSFVNVYLSNTTSANTPTNNLLASNAIIDQSSAWPSIIQDIDGALIGFMGLISKRSYWTQAKICSNISKDNFLCQGRRLVILRFQSICADFLNKTVTPILFYHISRNATFNCIPLTYSTLDGDLMTWSRFSSSLAANQSYQLNYRQTPPIDTIYHIERSLIGSSILNWLYLILNYEPYKYVSVYVSNQSGIDILIKPNVVVSNQASKLAFQFSICGSNVFYFQQGRIQFIVNNIAGCQVRLVQSSYLIMNAVTDSNLQDFDAEIFIQDIAYFLQIDSKRVRLVDLKSSSLQIVLYITAQPANITDSFSTPNLTQQMLEFEYLSAKIKGQINNNQSLFQGNILSLSTSYKLISIDKKEQSQPSAATTFATSVVMITGSIAIIICLTISIIRSRKSVYSANQMIEEEQFQDRTTFESSSINPLEGSAHQ